MLHAEYKEAFALSRNFDHRTLEDNKKLYAYISTAVAEAQDESCATAQRSLAFILKVYEPFIKKTAHKFYTQMYQSHEYEDVYQETVEKFLKLLYKYKPTLSSFSYYIYKFLKTYMSLWCRSARRPHVESPIKSTTLEILISDATTYHWDQSDFFDIPLIDSEYRAFITKRSKKESKSGTMKVVCEQHFLGDKSCSDIARELGISYHAVYEIINRIKGEVREFLKNSKYFEYAETSTGKIIL